MFKTRPTKFEVSLIDISTRYEDVKGDAKCRDWGGMSIQGHTRSLDIAPFDSALTDISFLL